MIQPSTRSTHRRTAKWLPAALDRKLVSYAAAAAAAGVGLLAQTAEGKIIYTDVNLTIPADGGYIRIDINHDGIPDFGLYNFASHKIINSRDFYLLSYLSFQGSQPYNQVWAVETSDTEECALALSSGVKVDASARFRQRGVLFDKFQSYENRQGSLCAWRAAHHGAFLAIKFMVGFETHYGWAHVTVGRTTVLNGYAYETDPGRPILTGERNEPLVETENILPAAPMQQPASLGLLARGADGLAIWRKPEETVAI
jgi:hypothetical protein